MSLFNWRVKLTFAKICPLPTIADTRLHYISMTMGQNGHGGVHFSVCKQQIHTLFFAFIRMSAYIHATCSISATGNQHGGHTPVRDLRWDHCFFFLDKSVSTSDCTHFLLFPHLDFHCNIKKGNYIYRNTDVPQSDRCFPSASILTLYFHQFCWSVSFFHALHYFPCWLCNECWQRAVYSGQLRATCKLLFEILRLDFSHSRCKSEVLGSGSFPCVQWCLSEMDWSEHTRRAIFTDLQT